KCSRRIFYFQHIEWRNVYRNISAEPIYDGAIMVVTDRIFWRWYLIFVSLFSVWYLYQWRDNKGTWFLLVAISLVISIIGLLIFKEISLESIHYKFIKIPVFLGWMIAVILISAPSILTF